MCVYNATLYKVLAHFLNKLVVKNFDVLFLMLDFCAFIQIKRYLYGFSLLYEGQGGEFFPAHLKFVLSVSGRSIH